MANTKWQVYYATKEGYIIDRFYYTEEKQARDKYITLLATLPNYYDITLVKPQNS